MYQFLFKNKWAAIAFVILTLVSVQMLVGREGEKSVISRTQDQLLERREHMQAAVDDLGNDPATAAIDPGAVAGPASATEDADVSAGDDEELIDDTAGFDPTPEVEEPPEPSVDSPTEEDSGEK